MRVMVTGGAGYIGSVVTEQLLHDGNDVVVFDNLQKGHRSAVRAPAKLVEADLADGQKLRETLSVNRIDSVVHMAADALVGESCEHPAKYYQNNVINALNLLEAMRAIEVKHIVFSSSAATYGEPSKQPIEENEHNQPTNPYGESKLAFERALHWYDVAYGFRYASLRYFNAAGASEHCGEDHDPESHLIPVTLQVAAGRRQAVSIFGDDYPTSDGTCVRDYIHVIDLARAHVLALHQLDRGSRIYNLGCGRSGYSVNQVIAIAREVTGKTIRANVVGRRPGDPAVLVASSDKIKSELGWTPQLQDLRLIIESAWRWMLNHPNGYAD
ncbi:MAG TPA: UDP-glucose 4-epimerase GalE [Pyrinomonadaceae bacterium]|nr:UDP-glucose 4-epimerase GalE [Pyrinomonadaceae bacterium]